MKRVALLIALMGLAVLLASGVALAVTRIQCAAGACFGTTGPENMWGTRTDDVIFGLSGYDVILSGSGNDAINAGNGPDGIFDHGGNDTVFAGGGDDRVNFDPDRIEVWNGICPRRDSACADLRPELDNDLVFGGGGDDVITIFSGADVIYGGSGNDLIRARDGERDFIHCGEDHDTVYFNIGVDAIFACEVTKPYSGSNSRDLHITIPSRRLR